jgi:phosphohistidine phosphatase
MKQVLGKATSINLRFQYRRYIKFMPKQLYLFRHAEAVDKRHHENDRERELTPHGIAQSVQMGAYLSRGFLLPETIFCSTAIRSRQTATLAADAMKVESQKIIFEDELYDASTRTLFRFVSQVDDGYDYIMCVGHNPTLTYLAEYFTREPIGDIVAAGIAIIKFNITSWTEISQGNGLLVQYLRPDNSPGN